MKNELSRYKNKYRVSSGRLPDYDYGQNGAYFVTICTAKKACCFGNVVNNSTVETRFIASPSPGEQRYQMQYSALGVIAQKYWEEIPRHFAFVELGEWVVMPNHLHGILFFDREYYQDKMVNHGGRGGDGDAINRVSTGGGVTCGRNPMLFQNLSTVIRWYKGRVAFDGRKVNPGFAWQSRFYDHVVRNDEDLQRISEYIINNPQSWEEDDYFMYG